MKTCKRCGEIFDNLGKYDQYCMNCRKPKGYVRGVKRGDAIKCPVCQKEFIIGDYSKKYCSEKCYNERNRKRAKKIRS